MFYFHIVDYKQFASGFTTITAVDAAGHARREWHEIAFKRAQLPADCRF